MVPPHLYIFSIAHPRAPSTFAWTCTLNEPQRHAYKPLLEHSPTHTHAHPRRNQPQRAINLMAACRRAVHCADCHRQRDRAGRHCPGNIGQVVNDGHQQELQDSCRELCTSLPREASPHQTVPRREVVQCSTCVENTRGRRRRL
jgi:hypothetical protein